ncbi:glycosyltransferase family 39 protein [Hymenobacter sp. 15J16-1T3B]|uniref:glycosyltransferase family 39 protein n=1 Tax=Hymenobacter sp. 15J16-1T3B TaxID=2886941 RepID=UPI001D127823|nr:glycosyltransferase family 39 protein [Hymenobacter sp. 15J16-1T3B]MCC3158810.1 glycosyltransferase family 39 protein [Hymenobacter sp. 15J16-1T3B]
MPTIIENSRGQGYYARLLVVGVIVIVLARLFFVGKGTMAFPDETRYQSSLMATKSLLEGDWQTFSAKVASTSGRPGDAIVRLVPALLQNVAYSVSGLNLQSPKSLLIPVIVNWLVLAASTFLFYKVARLLLRDDMLGLLATLIYAGLINTNVYMRHVLPYDFAMCLMLYVLYTVLRQKQQGKNWTYGFFAKVGFLSVFLITVYPGFYMAPFIVLAVLLDNRNPFVLLKKYFAGIVVYGLAGASVLLLFELIARLGGASYLISSFHLAHTIDQGSYEEGFSFIFKYLYQVEGVIGVALIALFALYVVYLIRNLLKSYKDHSELADLDKLVLVVAAFYCLHGFCTYFVHKMVFYGRLMHPFIPFVVIGAVSVIPRLAAPVLRRTLTYALPIMAVVSFGLFFKEYVALNYPFDILSAYHINTNSADKVRYVNEIGQSPGFKYDLPQPVDRNDVSPVPATDSLTLINFAFLFPMKHLGPAPDVAKLGSQVLFDGLHFLNFRAYQFEGFTIAERELLRTSKFHFQIRTRGLPGSTPTGGETPLN